MAEVSYGFIAPASGAREQGNVYSSGNEIALHQAIAVAIMTATHTGLTTTTVSCSSYVTKPAAIENQMSLLSGLGYAVSYSTTTLTITW